ncbi:unnamed protein product [Vitrella brassicaformis CCMP3155]|uniref:Sushi domain-containing protein n=1 Tax=Vitrella brassicaformis (strain CCMP3155) TaxID=1169540 RepID=A0A0G4H280_VITBC|nr:unnamed protein product [Vitrella brassicaformis CCMP3155]|eukprot:CEM37768.1 unnamed protein product [Vitrella brassicaformis CCMP3155]
MGGRNVSSLVQLDQTTREVELRKGAAHDWPTLHVDNVDFTEAFKILTIQGMTFIAARELLKVNQETKEVQRWKDALTSKRVDTGLVPLPDHEAPVYSEGFGVRFSGGDSGNSGPFLVTEESSFYVGKNLQILEPGFTVFLYLNFAQEGMNRETILFDSQTGFKIFTAPDPKKRIGHMLFGVLIGKTEGTKQQRIFVEACWGRPTLYTVAINPHSTGRLKVTILREKDDLLGPQGLVNLDETDAELSKPGRFYIGADEQGSHCFHGSLQVMVVQFRGFSKTQLVQAIDEIEQTILVRKDVCGDGVVGGMEECDGDDNCSCNCQKMCPPWPQYEGKHKFLDKHLKLVAGAGSTGREVGDYRYIECQQGFTSAFRFLHKETITCEEGGNWAHPLLTCQRNCPTKFSDADPRNHQYLVAGPTEERRHGTHLTVSCKARFTTAEGVPDKPRVVKCLNGHWTNPGLQCFADCPEYADLGQNLYRVEPERGKGPLRHGSIRNITCVPPAVPSGNSSYAIVYCLHGRWQTRQFSCEMRCRTYGRPPPPYRIVRTSKSDFSVKPPKHNLMELTYNGDWIDVGCNPDESAPACRNEGKNCSGDPTRIWCLGGMWTQNNLQCLYNCPPFEEFPLMNTKGHSGLPDRYRLQFGGNKHGDFSKLFCNNGYSSATAGMEFQTIKCWNGTYDTVGLDCRADCATPPRLPEKGYRLTGTGIRHNDKRVLECDASAGYASISEVKLENITCIDGIFTGRTLQCRQECPKGYLVYLIATGYKLQRLSRLHPPANASETEAGGNATELSGGGDQTLASQLSEAETGLKKHADIDETKYDMVNLTVSNLPLTLRPNTEISARCDIEAGYSPADLTPTSSDEAIQTREPVRVICLGSDDPMLAFSKLSLECAASCDTAPLRKLNEVPNYQMVWSFRWGDRREVGKLYSPQDILEGALPPRMYHNAIVRMSCSEGYASRTLNATGYPGSDRDRLECIKGNWTKRTLTCAAACPDYPELPAQYKVEAFPEAGAKFHGAKRWIRCDPELSSSTTDMQQDEVTCDMCQRLLDSEEHRLQKSVSRDQNRRC